MTDGSAPGAGSSESGERDLVVPEDQRSVDEALALLAQLPPSDPDGHVPLYEQIAQRLQGALADPSERHPNDSS